MLEAHALQENALEHPKAPISSVRLAVACESQISVHERIVEAKRLVESASRVLGAQSNEEPFGLRVARALVLSLLDELTVLDSRRGR